MKIESTLLKQFRNYEEERVIFSNGVNVFIGNNGHGKTNLLEALYLISRGDTFRPSKVDHLVSKNHKETLIKTIIHKSDLKYKVDCHIKNDKKSFSINGKKSSAGKLFSIFPTILFSPESLSVIKEGPEQRRLLIDETVAFQNHENIKLLKDFRKALRQRNKVLRDFAKELQSKKTTMGILESLDPLYLDLASQLSLKRIQVLDEILPFIFENTKYILNFANLKFRFEYKISGKTWTISNRNEIYNAQAKRINELRDAELAAGTSLVGPHKHELSFVFDDQDSRYFCSQGQQRSLILAFKLAQIVYHKQLSGEYPVLLLDDVLSELDLERQERLIKKLCEQDSQIFLTSTDVPFLDEFKNRDISIYRISNGHIENA